MNYKRTGGIVIFVVGIILTFFAIHSMKRIAEAKENINTTTGILPDNSMKDVFGSELNKKASQYDTMVLWVLIGGVVLIVVGGYMTLCKCKKRK